MSLHFLSNKTRVRDIQKHDSKGLHRLLFTVVELILTSRHQSYRASIHSIKMKFFLSFTRAQHALTCSYIIIAKLVFWPHIYLHVYLNSACATSRARLSRTRGVGRYNARAFIEVTGREENKTTVEFIDIDHHFLFLVFYIHSRATKKKRPTFFLVSMRGKRRNAWCFMALFNYSSQESRKRGEKESSFPNGLGFSYTFFTVPFDMATKNKGKNWTD